MKNLACLAALAAAACAVSAAPEIVNLGLPPGQTSGIAYAVTPDGSAAIVQGGIQSYLWRAGSGYTQIPPLAGSTFALAYDLSDDGTVVVGESGGKAFYWTAGTGTVALPPFFPGGTGPAYAVSADGTIAVGESTSRAMRWVIGQPAGEALPNPFPNNFAQGLGADADCDTVVGIVAIESGSTRAMRWTASEGMQNLGVIPGANFSRAEAASPDGTVVTGYSQSPSPGSGPKMFRWTAQTGLVNLGTVVGNSSFGYGVNADGSIIVGDSGGGAIWTDTTGIMAFRDFLIMKGVPGVGDWISFGPIRGVSPDGDVMIGTGSTIFDPALQPFIVRGLNGDEPCTGDSNGDDIVNFADLNAVLAAFGQTGAPGTIPGDLNNDGVVNFADLNTVLANFGSDCAG
jgi:uncharacterized membrane protein